MALIDTGVSPVKGLDGSGKVIYGPDFTPEATDPALANLDGYGHGTFMAGLIGGNDSSTPTPAQTAALGELIAAFEARSGHLTLTFRHLERPGMLARAH